MLLPLLNPLSFICVLITDYELIATIDASWFKHNSKCGSSAASPLEVAPSRQFFSALITSSIMDLPNFSAIHKYAAELLINLAYKYTE